jgi:hypothetical protein
MKPSLCPTIGQFLDPLITNPPSAQPGPAAGQGKAAQPQVYALGAGSRKKLTRNHGAEPVFCC